MNFENVDDNNEMTTYNIFFNKWKYFILTFHVELLLSILSATFAFMKSENEKCTEKAHLNKVWTLEM